MLFRSVLAVAVLASVVFGAAAHAEQRGASNGPGVSSVSTMDLGSGRVTQTGGSASGAGVGASR